MAASLKRARPETDQVVEVHLSGFDGDMWKQKSELSKMIIFLHCYLEVIPGRLLDVYEMENEIFVENVEKIIGKFSCPVLSVQFLLTYMLKRNEGSLVYDQRPRCMALITLDDLKRVEDSEILRSLGRGSTVTVDHLRFTSMMYPLSNIDDIPEGHIIAYNKLLVDIKAKPDKTMSWDDFFYMLIWGKKVTSIHVHPVHCVSHVRLKTNARAARELQIIFGDVDSDSAIKPAKRFCCK